jgi:hypothetical protein
MLKITDKAGKLKFTLEDCDDEPKKFEEEVEIVDEEDGKKKQKDAED